MQSTRKNNKSFLIQGTILAIAGLLVRVIGLVYRVPLNNILGEEGVGYYSNAYDIYSLLLLLSSLSLPLAVSKIISAKKAQGNIKSCKRIFICSLIFALIVGTLIGGITFIFAEKITFAWGYPSCAPALMVLAPTLFIMTFVGVLRGYFQGMGDMIPTAISQIFEQIINAVISIYAASRLTHVGLEIANKYGPKGNMGASYGAAGGTLGTCMGALSALIYLAINYFCTRQNRNEREFDYINEEEEVSSYKEIFLTLVVTIVPVLLSTTIYNFSNLIDSAIYGNILRGQGVPEDIKTSIWGVYSGRYRLVSNVPIAIASALSSSVVPAIVISHIRGEKEEIVAKIKAIIKFTMLIAFPCGIGLMALGRPIMAMLFIHTRVELSENLMMFSLFTVVSFSLSTITNSILQGIDKLRIPVIHAAISLGIHIVLLSFLLQFTNLRIYAVVICDILFAVVVCLLNAVSLRKYTDYKADYTGTYILPLSASLVMGGITYFSYKLLHLYIPYKIATFICVGIGMISYVVLLIAFKVITKEELLNMPKGNQIYKLLQKVKLMK